jgi:hypothetical protein
MAVLVAPAPVILVLDDDGESIASIGAGGCDRIDPTTRPLGGRTDRRRSRMRLQKPVRTLLASFVLFTGLTAAAPMLPASAAAKGLPQTAAGDPPYVCKPDPQLPLRTKCVQTIPGVEQLSHCLTVPKRAWAPDVPLYFFGGLYKEVPITATMPEEKICAYKRVDITNVYVFDRHNNIVKKKLKAPVTVYTRMDPPVDVFGAGAQCEMGVFTELWATASPPKYLRDHGDPGSLTHYISTAVCGNAVGLKILGTPLTPLWRSWVIVARDYKLGADGVITAYTTGSACEFTSGWCTPATALEFRELAPPR